MSNGTAICNLSDAVCCFLIVMLRELVSDYSVARKNVMRVILIITD